MRSYVVALGAALSLLAGATASFASESDGAAEYSEHLAKLGELSVAVAEAMPSGEYGFRPHPDSMNFGELMTHIAATNYQFCAGLQDASTPALPTATGKDAIIRFLGASFEYCSTVIPRLTESQLKAVHNSPDGRLPGKEILLAMYIHVAHHRGQAEIYLRDKGITPPRYRI